jgi:hypothetical protein
VTSRRSQILVAARHIVAIGGGSIGHVQQLQRLIAASPAEAAEAYEHARRLSLVARAVDDRDEHDDVSLTIAATAASVGVTLA